MIQKIINYRLEVPEDKWRKFTYSFSRELSIQKKLNQMIEIEGNKTNRFI